MIFLADAEYPWFYWIAPILALSFVAVLCLAGALYTFKVLLPRYRGKRVE